MYPPNKRFSLKETESLPAVLDVEASGFGRGSYPIEVGVACPNGQTYCSLIQPEPEWTHWDCRSEQVHGISRAVLHAHGKSVREVATRLNALLEGQCVYSDAWGNDLSWLGTLFEAAGLRQSFRLESLRAVIGEEQADIWHPTRDAVVIELDLKRHRASSDALILQKTYARSRALVRGQANAGQ